MASEIPSYDMRTFENRLKTYKGWAIDFLPPGKMAASGFHYLGHQDQVRCGHCFKTFEYWVLDDDPTNVHKTKSPDCKYFNNEHVYEVCALYDSVIEEQSNQPVPVNSLPTCRLLTAEEIKSVYNARRATIENSIQSFQLLSIDNTVEQRNKIKDHRFELFEFRMKTFLNFNWMTNQNIHYLSEAGFIFIGNSTDVVTMCFSCKLAFKNWSQHFDPWTEHALYSPHCKYVLEIRGEQFINDVLVCLGYEPNPEIVFKSQSIAMFPIINKNTAPESIEGEPSSEETIREITRKSIQKAFDFMSCKVCFEEDIQTVFIPCGHIFACYMCTKKMDHCGICRVSCDMFLFVFIHLGTTETVRALRNPPADSSELILDPVLCKVCRKENMEIVFMPCMHVYACSKCTNDMNNCPICDEEVIFKMKVYM